jgi:hypothetical protein
LALQLIVAGERLVLGIHTGCHLVVAGLGGQVSQLDQVAGARLEASPGGDVLAQRLGFAQDLLGLALVIPEAGLGAPAVEVREASLSSG